MPPLKNFKHEQFANKVLTSPTVSKAYESTYQSGYNTARANGSTLLANTGIRSRIQELLRETHASEKDVTGRLSHFIWDDNQPALSLDATKTALKIYGAFEDADAISGCQMVNITISPLTISPV